jgi:hypothetical protein
LEEQLELLALQVFQEPQGLLVPQGFLVLQVFLVRQDLQVLRGLLVQLELRVVTLVIAEQ